MPQAVDLDWSIFYDKSFKTAVHFRFECESLKINFTAFFISFFNSQKRTMMSVDNE